MPRNERSAMDQRIRFIADYLDDLFPFTELCLRYDISRPTGYKWVQRDIEGGAAGLMDRSRRPNRCPHATSSELIEAILEARHRHPTWGAKKLLTRLTRAQPYKTWPARTTVCDILKRQGLVPTRRTHPRPGHPGKPETPMSAPNHIWTADFKGQFKTLDGKYCYPLTVVDGYSRFLLGCQALDAPQSILTRPVFHRLFREYGLPQIIRTDNGAPFATATALARLSRLSVWWIQSSSNLSGPSRMDDTNACTAPSNRRPPFPPPTHDTDSNTASPASATNTTMHEYNHERPHEALDQSTPAEIYQRSSRPLPKKLPPLHYPEHWEVRLVSNNGGVRWKVDRVLVSFTLRKQYVGFEPIDDGIWEVWFGPLKLGRFDERQGKIIDALAKNDRRKV